MTRRAMIQKWILYGLCALALVLAEIFCIMRLENWVIPVTVLTAIVCAINFREIFSMLNKLVGKFLHRKKAFPPDQRNQCGNQHLRARADDEGALLGDRVLMHMSAVAHPAVYVARERQQHEEQQRADKREAARQCLTHYQRGGIVQRRGADRSKAEVKHLALTGVLPAAAVEPERAEHQHRQYRAGDAAVSQRLEEAERRDERPEQLNLKQLFFRHRHKRILVAKCRADKHRIRPLRVVCHQYTAAVRHFFASNDVIIVFQMVVYVDNRNRQRLKGTVVFHAQPSSAGRITASTAAIDCSSVSSLVSTRIASSACLSGAAARVSSS